MWERWVEENAENSFVLKKNAYLCLAEKHLLNVIVNKTHRFLLAWSILLVLIIPLVTKPLHLYESAGWGASCPHAHTHTHTHENGGHTAGHDGGTCLVCCFTLSFFTESSLFFPDVAPVGWVVLRYVVCQEEGYQTLLSSHYLRAPPVSV